MILSDRTALPALVWRGVVDAGAILDGGAVVASQHRNWTYRIDLHGEPSLFVKQARPAGGDEEATVLREAAWLSRTTEAAPLPRLVWADAAAAAFATEWVGGRSLADEIEAAGQPPVSAYGALGAALACLHSANLEGRSTEVPFGLRFCTGEIAPPWEGAVHVLAAAREDEAFCSIADRLVADWTPRGPMHGDVRPENVLVENGFAQLVDWELAGLGDPAWDVATALAHVVARGMIRTPFPPGGLGPDEAPALAVWLGAAREAAAALWDGYVGAGGDTSVQRRAVEMSAIGLVQTAYEHVAGRPRATTNAIALVQAAVNVASDPGGAASELYGLGAEPG